jgi:hypothetical protein
MTTYVFGAGASVHAGYPLARNLGTSLREWLARNKLPNPAWADCINELHRLYGELQNFEQILTDLMECPSGSPVSHLKKSERSFFLQAMEVCIPEFFNDVRRGPTLLYERLVREKIRPGDVVVTFNYDVAIERELKRAGLWEISDGYGFLVETAELPPSQVAVLKLHGSTNWLDVPFEGMTGTSQFNGPPLGDRPRIRGPREFEALGYPPGVTDFRWPTSGPFGGQPAVILPGLKKTFFKQSSYGKEREEFWDSLWDQATTALQTSERLVVIGYCFPKADERARHMIFNEANRKAQISLYCGRGSDTICEQFRASGLQHVECQGNARFEEFLGVSQTSCAAAR